MKILIIHGSPRRGNTWKILNKVKEKINEEIDADYEIIELSKMKIPMCTGCFNCILKSEEKCPHYESIKYINDKITWCDAMIITSPVYSLQISGQLKNFIDHMSYNFHRPKYFNKKALIITTTGGVRAKEIANYIVDTTNMKPKDLKEEILKIYSIGEKHTNLTISVLSFGFKHGIPKDSDLVFDVRFLPNPYYLESLRNKTGDDQEVRDYVMNSDISKQFYAKLTDMIDFLIPQYVEEGKHHLVISIGCTGGRHRSVTIANLIAEEIQSKGYRVVKKHRDFMLK